MRRRLLLTVAGIALLTPASGTAQTRDVQPGARVRVTAPSIFGARYAAVVGARRGDTLSLVRQDAQPVDVPLNAVTSIDISRGKSRWAGARRGLLWGAGVGVVIAALVAAAPDSVRNGGCSGTNCNRFDVGDAGALMLGSLIWGGGIGALVGRERWETLRTTTAAGRVRESPINERLKVGLVVRF